jgi:type VI secretion system protein ImpF
MSRTALTFQIEGTLWAQPAPLRLLLQTDIDLETGHAEVRELSGR